VHGWFERYQRRQRELAAGADADLMAANRRRYRLAFSLMGLGLFLVWLAGKLRLPSGLRIAATALAGVSFVVGVFLAQWARAEREFLTRPDLEPPPHIFTDRKDGH
jgi:uncharacterized membrane protein